MLTDEYTEMQLDEINSLNNIDEINAKYPIQCLRKNGNSYYVVYRSSQFVLIMTFDSNGSKLLGHRYSATKSKNDFSTISLGKTLENVQILDEDGDYTFLYTGRSDAPRISSHYTTDGYLIKISYDDKNIITNISSQLI